MNRRNSTRLLFIALVLLFSQKSLLAQNIALGKSVQASSSDAFPDVAAPTNVNDGLGTAGQTDPANGNCLSGTCTRWASAPQSDPQSIVIDLAARYNLTEVIIYWEAASANDFTIDISDDSTTWTTVATITDNSSFVNTIDISGNIGRYVRMNGISRNLANWGYSIWEFEVYGSIVTPLGPNVALGAPVVASSAIASELNAVDGDGGTGEADYSGGCGGCDFWASATDVPEQWIYVDLGSLRPLYQLILYWRQFAYATDFTIEVSANATDWTTTHTVTGNSAYVNTFDLTGYEARYVRMSATAAAANFGYGLYEMEVYDYTFALPITLYDFKARINDKVVEVEWTASLDHASEFVVERSQNGKDFTAIGTINTASGTGGMKKSFAFTDVNPLPGKSFYRLKYTEVGSAPILSRITSVNYSGTARLAVYPNPVQKGQPLFVDMNKAMKGNVEIRMVNTLGVTVFQKRLSSNGYSVFEIPAGLNLGSGTYLVQVLGERGEKLSKLIQVQ